MRNKVLQFHDYEKDAYQHTNQYVEEIFYSNLITFEWREGVGDHQGHPMKNNCEKNSDH